MKEMILAQHRRTTVGSLNDEIKALGNPGVKIYRTYLTHIRVDYVFVTASKDIHLFLGRLTHCAQQVLVKLIEEEMADGQNTSLLIYADSKKEAAWLTTLTKEGEGLCFIHLSMAH